MKKSILKQIIKEEIMKNNEFKRMQKLAGIKPIKESNKNELYYNRALEVVESYEDENQLRDFENQFPKNQPITKEKWFEWNEQYIDDMSELVYIEQHWEYINTGDESVYDEEI